MTTHNSPADSAHLYTREAQERTQDALADTLTRAAAVVRGAPDLLGEEDLLSLLAICADAHAEALAQTPEAKLRHLTNRNTRRVAAGVLILLVWFAILAGVGGAVVASADRDMPRLLAWLAVLTGALAANHALAQLPRASVLERAQLRTLAAWKHRRSCPVCGHGRHLPGQCPWGITWNTDPHSVGEQDTACFCGVVDEDTLSL